MKTLAPGGIRTDFAGRSLDQTRQAEHDEAVFKASARFRDPARDSTRSSAEQIAEVAYEAVTDDTDRITYIAGADAQEYFALRDQLGQEGPVSASTTLFFGS